MEQFMSLNFSVNTNVGAFIALQQLTNTNAKLQQTQNRISTGLKVASTKDDSATYAIAQNLRSDLAGFNAVKGSLDRAKSTLDVAVAAVENISDVLIQMREKAQAATITLDAESRLALQQDFNNLRDQLTQIIDSATFNETNLLKNQANGAAGDRLTALLSDNDNDGDASNGFQVNSFNVPNLSLSLGNGVAANDVNTPIQALPAGPGDQQAGGVLRLNVNTTFTNETEAANVVRNLDASIANINVVSSKVGTAFRRIEQHTIFVNKLFDVTTQGIGNLVDADLAKESATLQALQVKQQLGLQALGIANQAPQAIISLFQR
jgi:flagellin